MNSKIAIISICIISLYGCVSVPKHDLAPLSEPISLKTITDQAVSDPLFTTGEWPVSEWWKSFGDPLLNDLIQRALQDNSSLKKAQAQVELAVQLANKQRSSLLPRLDLEYQEQWEYFSKNGFVRSFYPSIPGITVPATANQIDLTLNFSYEFDFWGKNKKKLQAALGEIQTAAAERAQSELIVTTYLAQTYFQLQSHLEQQKVLKQIFDQRLDLYTLSTSRMESGVDPLFPVLGAEKNISFIEQLLVAIDKEIQLDRYLIQMLIGQGPDTAPEMHPTARIAVPFSLPQNLSLDLLARRPDLQAQIWRVKSASKEIGVAKTEFYPNINLCAFAGLESLAFSDLFSGSSHQGALQPALHLPIFTAGKLRANLRSKVAFYNEMVFAYNDQLLHAVNDVANQIVLLRAKSQELAMQTTAVEIITQQYDLKALCFEKGIGNALDLLTLEEDVLNQRLALVYLQRDYLLATLQLIKALGGGYAHIQ